MDWIALRDQFPVTRRWAFFDHAAVAPLPAPTRQVMREWVDDVTENGVVHSGAWRQRIEEARQHAAGLLGCEALDLAFIKNTSEGIGIVAEGFPWRPGDNMVTAAEEYPSNVYPWQNLCERGVETRLVPSRGPRILIDDIRDAIDARTRLVSLSWVEFSSGFRNDLMAVGSLCRERGIHFFVDAIQGLGVLPMDLRTYPIDFLAADGHKWLLGPEGAGILYVRRDLVDALHPVGVGWHSVVDPMNFSNIDFRLKPHAGRWESGAHNVVGVVGFGASMKLLLEIGIANVAERVHASTEYLCERVRGLGVEVFSCRTQSDWSGIVSIELAQGDPNKLLHMAKDASIVINVRAGRVRLSPHCYNSTEEIDHFLDVLKSFMNQPKYG